MALLTPEKQAIVVKPDQQWIARNENGEEIRRLRVLAAHPDGGWIVVDMPSKMARRMSSWQMVRCPELNLKIVFDLDTSVTQ